MLDDTRWPATLALIDEACGFMSNALMVNDDACRDLLERIRWPHGVVLPQAATPLMSKVA